ncbi:hypothetical protein ACWI_17490 [Acetobacterium wieringae]|jgi:hypothetical protein|nr:DUF1292 domain-containing protein [Acetobacterium wieringae]MEA4806804.1 DUF1292 domain-containing protein [Acetobacterium wieringae]OFV70729.1 hypothetical protein ACWI_17490 [Acetobacterium wieringae]
MNEKNKVEREVDMEEKIILEDENGVAREFDLEISFPLGEKTYVLLTEGEESDDVFAFFIDEDEEGEILVPVEDEAEFALIEAEYDRIMDEEYEDFEEDEDEGEVE